MAKQKNKNKLATTTLFVDGMHCASCEILIEKKLLDEDSIELVDASLSENKVRIVHEPGMLPSLNKINGLVNDLGYKFSKKKIKKDNTPAFQLKNGQLSINPTKAKALFRTILLVISFLIAFFVFENMQLGQYVSVDENSALPAFFALGLVAGLSSCAALIGGLLLSMIKQWNEIYIATDNTNDKAKPHILFHVGRLISFALFGGVLGLLGETVSLSDPVVFAILTVLVSLMMLVLALQMLGVEWAQKFKFTMPKSVTKFAANEDNFQGKYMPFLVGAFTFILPCGFTLIAQTIALTSGSFITGALIMLFFALGTLPTLVAISLSGLKFNSKPHLTAKFNIVAGLLIVFFALYNINGQLNVLGLPSLSDISLGGGQEVVEGTVEVNAKGQQVLNVTAKGFEYIPTSSMQIKAGVPTKLIVDNQGIQGCGSFMAANGLINGYVALKAGVNEIDLGKPQAGVYKLTCTMGMVRPITIEVI